MKRRFTVLIAFGVISIIPCKGVIHETCTEDLDAWYDHQVRRIAQSAYDAILELMYQAIDERTKYLDQIIQLQEQARQTRFAIERECLLLKVRGVADEICKLDEIVMRDRKIAHEIACTWLDDVHDEYYVDDLGSDTCEPDSECECDSITNVNTLDLSD